MVGNRGTYRLAKPLESMQVPATVQAVRRRASTACHPREASLQTAAVIGTEVPFTLLQAIGDLSERNCAAVSATCRAAESSMKPASSPSSNTPQARPHPRGGLPAVSCWSGAGPCTPGIVAAIEWLYADRLTEQWNGWPSMLPGRGLDKGRDLLSAGRYEGVGAFGLRRGRACVEQAMAALTHLLKSRARRRRPSTSSSTCGMRS